MKSFRKWIYKIIAVILCLIGLVTIRKIKNIEENTDGVKKVKYNLDYSIDYDKLNCEVNVETTQYLDGYMITLEEYSKIKKKEAKKELKDIKILLGNKLYKEMIKGLNSSYFSGYCRNEYNKVYNVLQMLFSDISAVDKLFEESKLKDINNKCNSDSCEVVEYINKYAKGKVKELLLESHMKYETLINKQELTDKQKKSIEDNIAMYYAKDLCENKDYIDSLKVRVRITPYNEYKSNKKTNNYNELIITDKNNKILNYITLYKCYNFFDEALGLNSYRNKLAVENEKKKFKRVTTFSICNYDDKEKLRLEYEIINCKHVIKQSSERKSELLEKVELHFKEKNLMEKIEKKKEKNKNGNISMEEFLEKSGISENEK